MRLRHRFIGASAALGFLATVASANASSHREAPAISFDPAADNTDLWAWVPPDLSMLFLVAAYNPLEEPSGGPNFNKFSDDVLYQIHIARGDQSLEDAVTYDIRFTTSPIMRVDVTDKTAAPGGGKEFFSQLSGQTQTYSIVKREAGMAPVTIASGVPVAPSNIGPRTNVVAYKIAANGYDAFSQTFVKDMGAEGQVFAGPRDDGFYVDLARIFDLANFAGSITTPVTSAVDGVAGFNCHAIAMAIPTSKLTGTGKAPTAGPSDAQTLGVWASASRRKVSILRHDGTIDSDGPWVQVSRLGLPLINEAVIGLQDKDKYNRTTPATDVTNFGGYFLNPIIVRDYEVVAQTTVPDSLKFNRTDILDVINLKDIPTTGAHNFGLSVTGDVLRVDLGVASSFPNGRVVGHGANPNQDQADVTDIELSLLLTGKTSGISDGVNSNDKPFLTQIPFLASPWEGATQGHGKPAP
ncbi:MAG TPA: DUF4331 domain-containing protein [Polyangiaceae bacterium]|nr:DUF4331 domain-containing protein [Polyangiaceae bacterium]